MMNKKDNEQRPGIIGLGIEELLKSQGILLEHDTHNALLKYFRKEGFTTHDSDKRLITNGVSHYFYLSDKNTNIEVDVYFKIQQWSLNIPYWKETLEGSRSEPPIILSGEGMTTHFLVQCKGHPNDGFLLCRKKNEAGPYHEPFHLHDCGDEDFTYIKKVGTIFVDWAYFYKVRDRETQNRKDGIPVYQEDKGKFYKGIQQLDDSVVALYDHQMSENKSAHSNICKNFKIVPMIVTNCPIYSMDIEEKIVIKRIPYALYINRTNCGSQHYKTGTLTEAKYYHIVNSQYIDLFIETIIDPEKDFNKLCKGENVITFHSIDR